MGSLGGSDGQANGHFELPEKSSKDINLVMATDAEMYDQQIANSDEWRGALSLEAYLRREVHLMDQDLTRDGGFTGWALVYQPASERQRRILCGCETLRKNALVFHNGRIQETITHGIGSVFCPPKYRGKGYAGRMMQDLGKRLQNYQCEKSRSVLFSVLYSDIGKQFYAKHGWQPFPSSHVSIQVAESPLEDIAAVQYLKASDLPTLCEIDQNLIRRRFAKSKTAERTKVAILPDAAGVGWHHAREDFIANELFNRYPEVKGAMVGEEGSRVWCYWTRVWTNPQEEETNTLHILRLVVEDEDFSDFAAADEKGVEKARDSPIVKSIAALFAAAHAEARRWDIDQVQIWNPSSTTLAAAQTLQSKVALQHREKESVASLQWYGEGSWEDVDWIHNEKYGWC